MTPIKKESCEYLRLQGRQRFDKVRSWWIDVGRWVLPHRTIWLQSISEGERNNHLIVDPTHVLALRSYVAGFLEGNTSATRPWYRTGTGDPDLDKFESAKEWLGIFTRLTLRALHNSNFYHAAGQLYYDYGVYNTGAHYIDERPDGSLYWHNLVPGSYYLLNNSYGEAVVLIREFSLTVKALVDRYGKKVNGKWDWSNFSSNVRKMYEDGSYTEMVNVVQIVKENDDFDPSKPQGGMNRKWVDISYELGGGTGPYYQGLESFGKVGPDPKDSEKYLRVSYSKRKPFIAARSETSGNFEYGQKGPSLDAIGLIKSLNKKALSKDQAIEQMLRPPVQGPSSLRKSYVSTATNTFIPLDAMSASQGGLKTVYEVNPAIGALTQDVADMRQQVDRLYYADYLLYLSRNPKTRTATETEAIVNEQQLIIGPNLQSLNLTYNLPVVDYVMDYVLDNDPHLPPPPEELEGSFLRPEFISVFAQAQKAADLPAIDRYISMIMNVGQIDPRMLDKANLDKLADIYEDRLYLPAGLNNPQDKVDAQRQQAMMQAQRQQKLEQIAVMAGAAKDISSAKNRETGETQ